MASVFRSFARPHLGLSQRSARFLSPAEAPSSRFRWIAVPGCFDRPYSCNPQRNWHPVAALAVPTSPKLSGLRNFSSPCSKLSRRKCSRNTHQSIQRRCFSNEFRDKPGGPGVWAQLDPRARIAVVFIVLGSLFLITHLERVPQTGRWRFMAFSDELEIELQDEQYKALLSEYRGRILPPDHPVTRQILNVVSTILEANGLGVLASASPVKSGQSGMSTQNIDVEIWDPDAGQTEIDVAKDGQTAVDTPSNEKQRKWNLMVVQDDDVVNAMVANGNIVVFTGILPIAHDMDGLAAVVSHEIAHVVARHLAEKLSSRALMQGIFYFLEFLGIDVGLGPLVVKFIYHLPNSRTMELEADKIGLQLAARACFDPRGAVSMQSRLARLEKQQGPRINLAFLQTHPSGEKRVKLLNDALPEAYALRAGSSACAQLEDDFDAFRAMADSVRSEQEREFIEQNAI